MTVRGTAQARPASGQGPRALLGGGRLPRGLHPVAWWIWALALAVAASRTTNPLLLLLIFGVLGLVVARRRGDAPWARGYRFYLAMALAVIVIRVVFRIVFESGITPGDQIRMEVDVVSFRSRAGKMAGKAFIDGKLACEATLTCMVVPRKAEASAAEAAQ